MSDENLFFDKPIGVLGRNLSNDMFGPPMEIRVKFAQNGLKIKFMDESFVAKTIDEAMTILKEKLVKISKDLKKNDKK